MEQITESGKIKDLTHRLSEIANDHITLAVHSLRRAEQNAKSGAGYIVQASEIENKLCRVGGYFIDLGFEVGRGDGVKSALEQERVLRSVFINIYLQLAFAAQIRGGFFVLFTE